MKRFSIILALLLNACASSDVSQSTSKETTTTSPSVELAEAVTTCALSVQQQAMLDAVNQARAEGRYCGSTFFPAAKALAWSCPLAAAAQSHSDDMSRYGFFSHTGSDGLVVGDRITAQQYEASTWAENIAMGYADVGAALQGLLGSDGHCENIMSADFQEFGAARSESAVGDVYWTQVFATAL